MSFLVPWAFAGLVALPIILALYFFKRKHIDVKVSSVFLWNKVSENQRAEKSIEKLKKNLLMFLQLIGAFLLVFAMTEPYIATKSSTNKYLLVIDNSLSMAAKEGKITRLDMAKADAIRLVKESVKGSSFSVVTLNSSQKMVVSSDNKETVIGAISQIPQSAMPVDYEQMPVSSEDYNTILYSDKSLSIDNVSTQVYGTGFDNCGIISLTTSYNGDTVQVLGKVKNFGNVPVQKQVSIYANGKLYGSKDIAIDSGETKDVIFNRVDRNTKEIKAMLAPEDSFSMDDTAYGTVAIGNEKKVLLSGDVNPFMERALKAVPNAKIYRDKEGSGTSGYDLYIYDGKLPDVLPADGHIIAINPPSNKFFKVDGEIELQEGRLLKNSALSMTEDSSFALCKSKKITLPIGAQVIAIADNNPIAFVQSNEKQKLAVIGFELNNSDLPLKKDFPVLVYDLFNYCFPNNTQIGNNVKAGENITFDIDPQAEKVSIIKPDETTVTLAPPFPASTFCADELTGIYYLEQIIDSKPVYTQFAVNITGNDEQNFSYEVDSVLNGGIDSQHIYNFALKSIILSLALVVLIVEIAFYIKTKRGKVKKLLLGMRLVCFVLIIAAMFDLKLPLPARSVTTVFTADLSDSMADNSSDIEAFINEALKTKSSDDETALAVFGKEGNVVSAATNSAEEYNLNSYVNTTATDLQKGIETAKSLFKKSTGNRLVIFTDGCETKGESNAQLNALKAEGVEIKLVPYDHSGLAEAEFTSLKVPEYILAGKCRVDMLITSTAQMSAKIQLYAGGNKIYEDNVELSIGENRFHIEPEINGSGTINLKGVIEPDVDKYYQNNTLYAHSYIDSPPKVLVLEYNHSGNNISNLVESQKIQVERLDVLSAPESETILNSYDAVIIADCPYYEMSEKFLNAIESYVKNSAGGLLVTAGENSFAPGGYKNTVLEKILPVDMNMTDEKKDTAIVMVVDRSGSMGSGQYGINKLELVKEAMVRSAEMLEANDSIGVLTFDDGFEWTISPEKIEGDLENVKDKIYKINVGGGTSIQPALEAAVNTLSGYDAASKHIILMTDGQGEDSGYESIIQKAAANNITISTVAAGNDAAKELLQSIAKQAGGRYYYTDEFTDLPKIFEKETAFSNKTYVNNEEFYPNVTKNNSILSGVDALPALEGYVISQDKNTAEVVLKHNNKEPVLALWQYGLGNTAVFASDLEHQCGKWLSTAEGQRVLINTISKIMRNRSFGNVETKISERNGTTIVTVETKNDLVIGINGVVSGENYEEKPVFEQTAPGVFEAALKADEAGNYVLNLSIASETEENFSSGVISIPYAEEYSVNNLTSGTVRLEQIYNYGEKIDSPEQVFTDFKNKIFDSISISLYLIILAIVVLLAELFFRRFSFKKSKNSESYMEEELPQKVKKDRESPQAEKEKQPDVIDTSSLLLKNKQKRGK